MKVDSTTPSEIIKLAGWIQNAHKKNYAGEDLDFEDDEYACAIDEEGYGYCAAGAIIQAQCNTYIYTTTAPGREDNATHADLIAWGLTSSWDNAHEGLIKWREEHKSKLAQPFEDLANEIMQQAYNQRNMEMLAAFWEITRQANRQFRNVAPLEERVEMIKEHINHRVISTWNDQEERTEKEVIEALEAVGL